MKKNHRKILMWTVMCILGWSSSGWAQTTIEMIIGGAKYITSGGHLSISITVDATTPMVVVGTAADQSFRDDAIGAAYFGYYISLSIDGAVQPTGTVANAKIRRGAGETSGRSYYLLGNGVTTPTQQSHLTVAPAAYTIFATGLKAKYNCGPNYSANGLNVAKCSGVNGNIVANMDITQFAKVLFTDPPSTPIVSQLDLIAVIE